MLHDEDGAFCGMALRERVAPGEIDRWMNVTVVPRTRVRLLAGGGVVRMHVGRGDMRGVMHVRRRRRRAVKDASEQQDRE